jgi:hypothetical protein
LLKKATLCVFGILFITQINGQILKDKIKKASELPARVSDKYFDDTTSKPNYLIYPTIAFTPETNWEIGLINLFLFYAKNDKNNRLSEVNTFTFYTVNKQYGLWMDHAIYGNKDKYFFLGKARFQYFPLKYYGIGNQAPKNDYSVINSYSIQVRERVLKKIKGNLFGGVEFDLQSINGVSFGGNPRILNDKPLGAGGSTNIGIGAGIVYDKRHNVLNERKGKFAELAYLNYSPIIGSSFKFHSLLYDMRLFRKGFGKGQVFAVQSMGQFNFGDVPFNMLSLMGGESMMRGYYLGRFRDKHMVTAQAEYRFLPFPFSKRIGGAVFLAAGSIEPSLPSFKFGDVKAAGGAGLRYLVFSSKDIFVRFDMAFTREGNGFYLFIGEAF